MRHVLLTLTIFVSQNICGQVKFGTYAQLDTSQYADLQLYSTKKFEFYDTRNGSCWLWTRTLGNWKLNKDTIVFSWQSSSTESSDSIISSRDPKTKNVEITFVYDDGIPIHGVEVSLSCLSDNYPKKYMTDRTGKVTIPQKETLKPGTKMCERFERMLFFEIKDKLSSNTSLDYYADSLDNVFKIVVKRNPKTTYQIETKKYLVKGSTLIDVDPKEFYNYNWGNFKFSTEKHDR